MAEVKISENKFKVGDRVKVVNCLLSPRLIGSYATVCNVFYESVFKERHIYKLKNLSKFKNITPYHWFDEKDLEFASTKKISLNKKNDTFTNTYEPYAPNKTIVSHEIIGNTTYVTLSNGDKGMARCNPEDKFDAYIGLKLATERAYGITEAEESKPKPKFEVGKKYIVTDSSLMSGGKPTLCGEFDETSTIGKGLKPYEEPKVKEVKRKAKVGEYIKLIKKDYYFNEVGDILKVTSMGKICVCVSTDNQPRKDEIVYPCIGWYYSTNEYVVLENYKPEDETQEIKEVRRVAKVGEYIKIVNEIQPFFKYRNGDILNVIVSNPTTVIAKDIPIQIRHEEYVVLENYKPEGNEKPKLKFKEGDCVFVRNATIGCQGANGYRGRVTNLEATNGLLKFCGLDTTNVRLDNGEIWRVNTDGLEFAKSNL